MVEEKKSDLDRELEAAALEEQKQKEADAKAKADMTAEIKGAAAEPTKPKEQFGTVKSMPLLDDAKSDFEDKDTDALKDELKKRSESKKDSFLKRTHKKVAIKLGKIAFVIADAERALYEKMHLNEPIMTAAEVEADYIETYNDTEELINNRIGIESEHGDIINVGLTVGSHIGIRAFRYYTQGKKKRQVDDSFKAPEDSEEEGEDSATPPSNLSPVEQAKWFADYGARHGRDTAPP